MLVPSRAAWQPSGQRGGEGQAPRCPAGRDGWGPEGIFMEDMLARAVADLGGPSR